MVRFNCTMEVDWDTVRRIPDALRDSVDYVILCQIDVVSIIYYKGKYCVLRYNST